MPRLFAFAVLAALAGCGMLRDPYRGVPTPAEVGINTRDTIDPPAQAEADRLFDVYDLVGVSEEIRKMAAAKADKLDPGRKNRPPKNVLCLSGGGSYGAFTAGFLVGWSQSGKRPAFDTVTGISTGALIAPLAFLGPQYDDRVKSFYTDITTDDIYRRQYVRGLLGEALADNTPLAERVERELSPRLIAEIAAEHKKGRRLYVGTTELEAKRFIVWDIGAIACRDGFAGAALIKKILLGSSAIPGFFAASEIPVTIDGRLLVEKHGDGGTSEGIFFRPPWHPDTEMRSNTARLAGTNVWCVVAGKLYADPAPLKNRSLSIAASSVSAVIYAQSRGDLRRIYTGCALTGMNYYQTAIPPGFDAPKSATDFSRESLLSMYNEGVRLANSGDPWRTIPPGSGPGESVLERAATNLVEVKRGAAVNTTRQPQTAEVSPVTPQLTPGPMPVPVEPGVAQK